MRYYVYILLDGEEPFYVGKGSGTRMYDHFRKAKRTKQRSPVLDKIRSMILGNREITYLKKFESNLEVEALGEEIKLISELGRRDLKTGPLLNLTDGGEGVTNYSWTDSHRANLSQAVKLAVEEGRHSPGRFSRSENYKKVMSQSLKEYWQTEEGLKQKQKLADEKKAKLINGKRILSDETRKRLSEAAKRNNALRKKRNIESR